MSNSRPLECLKSFAGPGQEEIFSMPVSGLAYDSREVKAGDAFFCLPGQNTDGNKFIADAIKNGAALIITEQECENSPIPCLTVSDVRSALALCADSYYGKPSRHLRLLGVTGTNGKTTTTHIIQHILSFAGYKVGLIGTLGSRLNSHSNYGTAKHTTPQAPELQQSLAKMAEAGCSHVAMEVSSHALALKRVLGCQFASACLTNITQDHLDFHKNMEHYWHSKRLLFDYLSAGTMADRSAIINADDEYASHFIASVKKTVHLLTYGFSEKASIRVLGFTSQKDGTDIDIEYAGGKRNIKVGLAGQFNVYNTLAALAVCLAEGISIEVITESLRTFTRVEGRFEVVSTGRATEPLCIVDYAHTPDGLEKILKAARGIVPPDGRLIAVFGCGGDRDSSKRPQMGRIAESLADYIYVTSDNPRTEEPQEIIANILAGIGRMKNVDVEPDRGMAINKAVESASARDIVIVAGKGHETYQILKEKTIHFDDREAVRKALSAWQRTEQ